MCWDEDEEALRNDVPLLATCHEFMQGPWRLFMGFHKEFFLRCLLTAAVASLKRHHSQLLAAGREQDRDLRIKIFPNISGQYLTISDNGAGMTSEELRNPRRHCNRDVLESMAEHTVPPPPTEDVAMGLAAASLVAKRIIIQTQVDGQRKTVLESVDFSRSCVLKKGEPFELFEHKSGTAVRLHLKEGQNQCIDTNYIKNLLRGEWAFVLGAFPVHVWDDKLQAWEILSNQQPLWERQPGAVPKVEIQSLYRMQTLDADEPLAFKHIKVEGQLEFSAILFVPRASTNKTNILLLKVQGTTINADGSLLLPPWLRFISGVVATPDLPCNVSMEELEGSRAARVIRKHLTKAIIQVFHELVENQAQLEILNAEFASHIKQGVLDPTLWQRRTNQRKLAALLLFQSSDSASNLTRVTLNEFVRNACDEKRDIPFAMMHRRDDAATGFTAICKAPVASLRDGVSMLLLEEDLDRDVLLSLEDGWDGRCFVEVTESDTGILGLGPYSRCDAGRVCDQSEPPTAACSSCASNTARSNASASGVGESEACAGASMQIEEMEDGWVLVSEVNTQASAWPYPTDLPLNLGMRSVTDQAMQHQQVCVRLRTCCA